MGKWTALKKKYPKLPLETDYHQKLNTVLNSLAPMWVLGPSEVGKGLTPRHLSDFQLARVYSAMRVEKEELEKFLKVVDLELEAYTRLFVERFEAAGETSKTFEGGLTLCLSDEPYPIVKDQAQMQAWIREQGLEDLLTLNYQTMSSLVKSALQEGKELPGGIDIYMKTKLRRGGGKKGEAVHEQSSDRKE